METTCDMCKGRGNLQRKILIHNLLNNKEDFLTFTCLCPKCQGKGNLNWLEIIFEKDSHLIPLYTIKIDY